MSEDIKRLRMVREMEEDFVPNYDLGNMPPADKRSAYALEYIAFRAGRIDKKLEQLVTALEKLMRPN